jgi:soluble lytic murein transglycosylase-like protein
VNAVQPLENNRLLEAQKTDGTKPSVVKWMKNRSAMPEQVLSRIYDEAARHTHPNLILAICAVESSFNPGVESEKGAVGLMGVLPRIWVDELKGQGVIQDKGDLYLIPNNIASGVYVLKKIQSIKSRRPLFNYVGGDSIMPIRY